VSLVDVLLGERSAVLLSDAAHYERATGRVLTLGGKSRAFPHLSCAVAAQSSHSSLARATLDALGNNAGDLGELIQVAADVVADMMRQAEVLAEPPSLHIGFAAWSHERDRPEAYSLDTTRGGHMVEHKRGFLAPGTPEMAPLLPPGPPRPENALRIVEVQRRHISPRYGFPIVGGWVERLEVAAEGIFTSIVARWPDRIGERIGETAQ
jgi:hypothetical protein